VPGNLASADRACGTVACHPSQVERVSRSLMTTMAGIVSVDRSVWGAPRADAQVVHVTALGTTGVDSHLRQLCASCHLGATKNDLGPIGEDSRGGGCNACHLKYGEEARAGLARYQRELAAVRAGRGTGAPTVPPVHPDVSIAIGNGACFGCHSRSGRISTSYEGWHEVGEQTLGDVDRGSEDRRHMNGGRRRLADGRVFTFVAADVHARSMTCIDCHTAREVMGDGVVRFRAHEQVRVACEDCHRRPGVSEFPTEPAAVIELESLDAESRRIAELRGRNRPRDRFLATANGRDPLLNTGLDDHRLWLVSKSSGERLPLKPPAAACVGTPGHARLSCVSCHTVWAPRCPTCHTAFDVSREAVDLLDGRLVRGAWVETGGGFRAVPPTLGIRVMREGRMTRETVDTFIPGMVLSIDRNQAAGGMPDTVFRRLYARSFSHTVGKSARSCQSCHAAPVALGYGEGTLRYERAGTQGRWRFEPQNAPGPDGLPADAWVGFLRERTAWTSTHTDVRPFTVEEQQRILTVGACLTCHEADGAGLKSCTTEEFAALSSGGAEASVGQGSSAAKGRATPCRPLPDFRTALTRTSPQCVLPRW
jgi:hypothetical protein